MSSVVAHTIQALDNRILVPSDGSIIQTVTKRVDARTIYATGAVLTDLDIVVTPNSQGNEILVEWTFNNEADSNGGVYILVNGSPYNTSFPLTGFALGSIVGYLNTDYGYTPFNRDGNNATTPSTSVILFSHRASSTNPVRFSLLYAGAISLYLNRTVEAPLDSREQGVSFVTAYEIVRG
jgi:hypothetical protein